MKLVKLSLAAVVAAGAFSAANAVALDEAIQNVDLHGMLRYRYTATRDIDAAGIHDGDTKHQGKVKLKITSEIADNFKAHGTLEYNVKDIGQTDGPFSHTDKGFNVKEAYLEYNNFDTQFNFGKMEIGSIWTDGLVGDGVVALNKSVEGVTFAAFMFDNFDKGESDLVNLADAFDGNAPATSTTAPKYTTSIAYDNPDLDIAIKNVLSKKEGIDKLSAQLSLEIAKANAKKNKTEVKIDDLESAAPGIKAELAKFTTTTVTPGVGGNKPSTPILAAYDHNLYGAAVLANFDPVAAQLWISYLSQVGTFYAADLSFNGEVSDGFNFLVHGQYAGNSLKGDIKDGFNAANGNFFAIEAGVDVAGLDAKVGYVGFGKKDKYTIHALHDKGQLINSGEIVMDDYHGGIGAHNYIFGEFGYTYEGLRAGFDVISGTVKNTGSKTKLFEITPRISYKYSDKLKFSSFYAIGQAKYDGGVKEKERVLRLEAKYTF